jgi:hypothetical protein
MRPPRSARLLLPLLALRALLPSGFMPVVADHRELALGFCPGVTGHQVGAGVEHPASQARGPHHERASHAPAHEGHGSTPHATACPFVAAGGAFPLPAPSAIPIAALAIRAAPAPSPGNPFVARTVVRAHPPRAPPCLS